MSAPSDLSAPRAPDGFARLLQAMQRHTIIVLILLLLRFRRLRRGR